MEASIVESELTFDEIANLCGIPLEQIIGWADQGLIRPRPAVCVPDSRVTISDLIVCLTDQGMAVPEPVHRRSRRGAATGGDKGADESACKRPRRVLIIDDDTSMANAIKRALRRSGYETYVAEDGFAAGSMLERLEPALITLDLSMPGLDGFDVLRFIRHQPQYRNLKVLVVSALPDNQLQRAIDLGANDALPKPFDNNELQRRIAILLAEEAEIADA